MYICHMDIIKAYRGIPPWVIIEDEIRHRMISQRSFAKQLKEHPQVLNDILKGKRRIAISLSMKLDDAFGFDKGTFWILQAYYEAEEYKIPQMAKLPPIRKVVFWDIDMSKLDPVKNKAFIINRVNERGSKEEKQMIKEYYDNAQ